MLNDTDYTRRALVRCETYLVNTRREDDPNVIVGTHDDLLRSVRLALSVMDQHVTVDELCAAIGSDNWVVARRTKRIVERYGEDVVTLSSKQLDAAERRAVEARFPVSAPSPRLCGA